MKTMFAIGLLALILYDLYENSSQTANTPKAPAAAARAKKAVNAEISVNSETLTIRNADSFDWPPLHVFINGTPFFGFGLATGALKPGEQIELPLREFSKDGGERFDPFRLKVKSLWIGGAGGFDFAQYGF